MRELEVDALEAGQRLDKFLQKYMALAPKSFFYKMLRKKNITCNRKKCDGSERIKKGDKIQLFLSEETIEGFRRQKETGKVYPYRTLDVIYEDSQILLINKPAGMLSQKAEKTDISLVEYLISYLLRKGDLTEESLRSFRPSVCNRLDRNTSGLITAGKTLPALKEMSELLRDRTIGKYYLCLVDGIIREETKIHGWLVKDEKANQVQIFSEKKPEASEIHTAYKPLAWGNRTTLLMVNLITGRSHQIRAHLASEGHPVIGDNKYGNRVVNGKYREKYHLEHQLLHAWCMQFPKAGGALSGLSEKTVYAPIPGEFERILMDEGIEKGTEDGRIWRLGEQEV